jgi:hypothetical protein
MIANYKEIICINHTERVIHEFIHHRVCIINSKKISLHYTPLKFRTFFINEINPIDESKGGKQINYFFILLIYIVALPIIILISVYEKIFGDSKYQKEISNIYREYKYVLDYEVSNQKKITKLWKDKGLYGYSIPDHIVMACIYEWFTILYDLHEKEFSDLIDQCRSQNKDTIKRFSKAGLRVSPASMEFLLINRIQAVYGDYS